MFFNHLMHDVETLLDIVDNGTMYSINKDASGNYTKTIQGICPKGWHIPYTGEFEQLIEEVQNIAAIDPASVGVDTDAMSVVTSQAHYVLVPCLPSVNDMVTFRGASQIALKGGLALTWNGSNSINGNQKDYGELSCYMVISDEISKERYNQGGAQYWGSNFHIRTNDSDWKSAMAYTSYQYAVRCKKDDTDMSTLYDYQDTY